MNIIKVKDFDSMQAITVGLARNGYMVTADSVTDENYKEHWEIKYCEFSEYQLIMVVILMVIILVLWKLIIKIILKV